MKTQLSQGPTIHYNAEHLLHTTHTHTKTKLHYPEVLSVLLDSKDENMQLNLADRSFKRKEWVLAIKTTKTKDVL